MANKESIINIEKDTNIHLESEKLSRYFFCFIWFLYAVVYMAKNCYNGALASIVSDGVLTKSQIGLISAMFYVTYTPLQVVGGFVADKYSPVRMIKLGLLGAALINLVIFLNQNYYVMLIAWTLNGAIQFAIWPSIFKIISSQLVKANRIKMIFYISFSSTAGLVMSYMLAAVVTDWRYNFFISFVVLLAFFIGIHFFAKKLNPHMAHDKKEPEDEKKKALPEEKTKISTVRLFAKSGFFPIVISLTIAIIVSQSRSSLAPIMFVENYDNVSPSLGNILNVVFIFSTLVGCLIAKKATKKTKNEPKAMIIISLAMLPPLFGCTFIGTLPVFAIAVFLCLVAVLEAANTLLRNYFNLNFIKYGKSGAAAGLSNAGGSFGFFVAAYVMPRIAELFGWKTLIALWPMLICVSVIFLVISVRMVKRFKEL